MFRTFGPVAGLAFVALLRAASRDVLALARGGVAVLPCFGPHRLIGLRREAEKCALNWPPAT